MTRTLLLIDHEPGLARDLRTACGAAGVELTVVTTGQEGLASAWRLLPQGIALRVEVRDPGGWAVCNLLKRNPRLREIPLYLFSERFAAETFSQHRSLRTHADHYHTGPIRGVDVMTWFDGVPEAAPPEWVERLRAISAPEPRATVERSTLALILLVGIVPVVLAVWFAWC